jgi:hypothetical protein
MKIALKIPGLRPYFAEIPYYLWGETNYDSYGNCRRPTDQKWTVLVLTNRWTRAQVSIYKPWFSAHWAIKSDSEQLASRTALFLAERSDAVICEWNPAKFVGKWSHNEGIARAKKVREVFAQPLLKPFDKDAFWVHWKNVEWPTDYRAGPADAARLIMNSIEAHA